MYRDSAEEVYIDSGAARAEGWGRGERREIGVRIIPYVRRRTLQMDLVSSNSRALMRYVMTIDETDSAIGIRLPHCSAQLQRLSAWRIADRLRVFEAHLFSHAERVEKHCSNRI